MSYRHRKGQPSTKRRASKRPSSSRRRELRIALRLRDGDTCHWCGRQLQFEDGTAEDYGTFDHLLKHEHGGTYHPDNLVLSCRPCQHEGDSQPVRARRDKPDAS